MKHIIIIILSINMFLLYPHQVKAEKFETGTSMKSRKEKKKRKNIVWYSNSPAPGKTNQLYVKY